MKVAAGPSGSRRDTIRPGARRHVVLHRREEGRGWGPREGPRREEKAAAASSPREVQAGAAVWGRVRSAGAGAPPRLARTVSPLCGTVLCHRAERVRGEAGESGGDDRR